jgi:uronate dehydrogenase
MSALRSSIIRAHHVAARFSSRFKHLEPFDRQAHPGVVITGAGGIIGRILRTGLEAEYAIRGLDVATGPGVDVVTDMRKFKRIKDAFAGAEAVVDLAVSNNDDSWEMVRSNLSMTLNALEAARQAGAKRVVFASSNHVTGVYQQDEPYASIAAGRCDGLDIESIPRLGTDAPIRPDSLYALSKAAGEAAARFYADAHGLSVICLRVGHVNLEDRPKRPIHFATLLTHRDLVQLVRCSLAAPATLRFGIFYGVSANTWRIWDIDNARAELGYEPIDNAEIFR